jgi:hypothetical protein
LIRQAGKRERQRKFEEAIDFLEWAAKLQDEIDVDSIREADITEMPEIPVGLNAKIEELRAKEKAKVERQRKETGGKVKKVEKGRR